MTALRFAILTFKARFVRLDDVPILWLTQFVVLLLVISVWTVARGGGVIQASIGQLAAYLVVARLLAACLDLGIEEYTGGRIQSGAVALDLASPFGLPRRLVALAVANATGNLLIIGPPIAFFVVASGVALEFAGWPAGAALSALLSAALMGLFSFVLSLLGFVGVSHYALTRLRLMLVELLGGVVVPLALYPDWLRPVAVLSPFALAIAAPAQIALGRPLSASYAPSTFDLFVGQIVWIVVLGISAAWLWRAATRRLEIFGG